MFGPQRGAALEQFHTQMAHGAHAGRAIAPLAAGSGTGREEGLAFRGVGRRRQHQRRHADQADGLQVLHRVVAHSGVQQLGNGHIAVDHHAERVAVRGLGHGFGGDVAARAHLVFHNDGLAQGFFQRLGQRAGGQIGGGARREAHDQVQGLAGPLLGLDRTHAAAQGGRAGQAHQAAAVQRGAGGFGHGFSQCKSDSCLRGWR